MSKHHRHNNNAPQAAKPVVAAAPAVQEQKEEVVDETTLTDLPDTVEAGESLEAMIEAEAAPAAQPEKVEPVQEAPKAEVPPPAPAPAAAPVVPPQAPAPVQPTVFAKKGNKVMAEEVLPSRSFIEIRRNQPVKPHTPAGIKLAQLWDEYKAMMSVSATDKRELQNRITKLYQITQAGCPMGETNPNVAADLVRVAFDKLMEGWGTIYKDSTMFRLDYSLGVPAQIDKLNGYIVSLIQLVEAATEGNRISFNDQRLSEVLKNQGVAAALIKMKNGINKRNAAN